MPIRPFNPSFTTERSPQSNLFSFLGLFEFFVYRITLSVNPPFFSGVRSRVASHAAKYAPMRSSSSLPFITPSLPFVGSIIPNFPPRISMLLFTMFTIQARPAMDARYGQRKIQIFLSRFLSFSRFSIALANRLRNLENEGLIPRIIYPEVPPRMKYALTDIGAEFKPVLDNIENWGNQDIAYLQEKSEAKQWRNLFHEHGSLFSLPVCAPCLAEFRKTYYNKHR